MSHALLRPPLPDTPSTLCGAHTVTSLGLSLEESSWYLAPELTSLWATPVWEGLTDPERRRLARFEAALHASSTIHGEGQVLGGLRPRTEAGSYLEVFVEEEENHQEMFRAYLDHLEVPLLPTRTLAWGERVLTDAEFFACVLVFEDVVAGRNRRMARDERLHSLVRAVNHAHAVEEAQHLRFGRAHLRALLPELTAAERAGIAEQVASYLHAVWRECYRSDVYELAGLPRPWALPRTAWAAPLQREARLQATRHALAPLRDLGIEAERIAA